MLPVYEHEVHSAAAFSQICAIDLNT